MSLAGQLYRSLYAYGPTDDEGDLTFPAGSVIMVTNKDAGDGWWEGELNGASGTFPASYVVSLSEVKKEFTAPEDTAAACGAPPPQPTPTTTPAPVPAAATAAAASIPRSSSPRSALSNHKRRKKKSLSWGLDRNSQDFTFAKSEYARSMDGLDHTSMQQNHYQWEKEEPDEKLRQLFVAFDIWERELPPGTKCPQRIVYEAGLAKIETDKQDKRRKFKEARDAKRRAQETEPTIVETGPELAPASTPSTESIRPVETVVPGAVARVDIGTVAEEPPPAAQALAAVVEAPDHAAQFVEILQSLQATTALFAADDERGNEGFSLQFRDLDLEDRRRFSLQLCQVAASRPECNRYKDILPYDQFRVPLNGATGYINASFVKDLLPAAPTYLAAQGPKPETIGHFWKTLAEHRCVVIAMLTRCIESNKRKCEEYWPAPGSSLFFDADDAGPAVGVVGNAQVEREHWIERRFSVVTNAGSHDVVQLHFTRWPDHGVPERSADAIRFIQEVMRVERAAGTSVRAPIAVHCSAGVGRTGVFAVLHAIMSNLPSCPAGSSGINIVEMVRHLRKSRRYMVQTIEQFKFCYAAATELVEQYIAAIRATPYSRLVSPVATVGLPVQVLTKQLKQSLRREYDANRARAELQKDLLEMTTGMRDATAVIDLQEDLSLARQRLLQMTKRNQEQGKHVESIERDIAAKDMHVKTMATMVGQLEMDMADKDDEIVALTKQLATALASGGGCMSGGTNAAVATSNVDYIAVSDLDDEENEAGYINLVPDAEDDAAAVNDDKSGLLDFASEPKPTMLLDAAGSESDSEL